MKLTMENGSAIKVKRCKCGEYPSFIQTSGEYEDIFLKCSKCGNSTSSIRGHLKNDAAFRLAKKIIIGEWNRKMS